MALAPDRQIRVWEDHQHEHLFRVHCSAINVDTLHASQRNCASGQIRFADMRVSPHVVERTARDVAEDPRDLMVLILLLEGEAIYGQAGKWLTLRAGDIIALRSDIPFLGSYPHPVRQMVMTLPVADFTAHCGREITGPERAVFAQLGARTVRWLIEHGTAWLDQAGELSHQTLHDHGAGLVAAVFGPRASARSLRQAPHFLAAQSWIADRLSDPNLNVAQIASALHITPRHLNRIFAREGLSVTRVIEDRRLSMAQHLLQDPHQNYMSIAEVAYACGFSDQALFSRKFRKHFDRSPSETRRNGHPGKEGARKE
ncbi:helix-turn-helix domain-containing protein [Rhodobacter lacus]|uniref:Helix-turn-helix domain-containing protein n=1 Tax=Rhodobacter lacus TaxID=1641972 RepID=A0ABW5A7A1_9RHOB